MSVEKPKRSQYFNPPATECPHSGRHHFDDWEEFHLPMARTHHAHLHDRGIAAGLEVSLASEGRALEVGAGVAVDVNGEIIALSESGEADVSANEPGETGRQIPAPFRLSTSGHENDRLYLTIQFAQILRFSEGSCGKLEQTPWLRLQPIGAATEIDEGLAIVLAVVSVDGDGVATLGDRESELPHRRRFLGQSLEEIRIRRGFTSTEGVSETPAGKIVPDPDGGLRLTVPETEDRIVVSQEKGGRFSSLELNVASAEISGSLTIEGDTDLNGNLSVGDGSKRDVLRLNTQAPWAFTSGENGGKTTLDLRAEEPAGAFRITSGNGAHSPLKVFTADTLQGNSVHLVETGGLVGIGTNAPKETLHVEGDVLVGGVLRIPTTTQRFASFSGNKFDNESSFQSTNVKLQLGSIIGFIRRFNYEFAVGHTRTLFSRSRPRRMVTRFDKVLSINHRGDFFCAGSKSGYVVDYFVNRVGDALEQGDVVVVSRHESSRFLGTNNNIPMPEVDLSNKDYDTRVCGVVANVVTEEGLPYVEPEEVELTPEQEAEIQRAAAEKPSKAEPEAPIPHPYRELAAPADSDPDATRIEDAQLGQMVTLGAFAHCKVNADAAPIAPGDLLTTSTMKGHAQKALDPARAAGAIVGKALGSLESGQGKIPVIVLMQ